MIRMDVGGAASVGPARYGHLYPGDVHQYVNRLGEVAVAARVEERARRLFDLSRSRRSETAFDLRRQGTRGGSSAG